MPSSRDYIDLARAALNGDERRVRLCLEAAASSENAKGNHKVARAIRETLQMRTQFVTTKDLERLQGTEVDHVPLSNKVAALVDQRAPRVSIDNLILPATVRDTFDEVVREREGAEVLLEHGVDPTSRVLLLGAPGTGKTSLAGALANALGLPFLVIKMASVIDSLLGMTMRNVQDLFDEVGQSDCVLLLDECEALASERANGQEHAELHRTTAILLTCIEQLPSRVVLFAATNHPEMLDRAIWRRFNVRMELPSPTTEELADYFRLYQKRMGFRFGVGALEIARSAGVSNYGDAREVCDQIYRRHLLALPDPNDERITRHVLAIREQVMQTTFAERMKVLCA